MSSTKISDAVHISRCPIPCHRSHGRQLQQSGFPSDAFCRTHKQSQDLLSKAITDLRKDKAGKASWNEIKDLLTEKMGFWKELPLTWEQEKMLRDEYEQSFVKNKVVFEESLYARTEPLAAAARKVMSQIAMVGWTSSSHTAGYVPVFAIGAGADLFTGKMDNTEIPKRIAKAAGYK